MHTLNRILQAGKLVPALEQALHARYSVHRLADEPDPAAFLAEHGAQFDAVVTSAAIGLPAQHLAALPSVKVISSFGVGLDKVPVEEAKARGIAVGYTPDVLNDCVADTAFALLLDVARRTAEADRFVRAGQWARLGSNSFGLGRKVSGARMGVVGKEAKELIGRLRIRQLLDPNGPDVKKYTVRKGDSWIRMVRKLGCSQAMVVHLNGLMDIPALHAGDVFKYRPLDFHVVVNVPEKEICLYDGTDFVKGYPILSMKDGGKKNVETTVKDEQAPVSIYSRQFPSADKTLVLAAGGYVIDAARGTPRSPGFYLSRQDCNELAMLTRPGTKVTILRGKGEEP